MFLVEQNAFHALKLAHRGYVMVNGEITLSGTGRELLERPEVRAAYLEGGRQEAANSRRRCAWTSRAWAASIREIGREEFMKLAHLARVALACALPLLAPFADASAQTGTIRFIVGLAPGGAVDPYARIISEHMAKTLATDHHRREPARRDGNISAQYMVDAPADGHLIWVGTQALTEINPSVFDNLRWKIDDFLPLIKGVQAPLVLRRASERSCQ